MAAKITNPGTETFDAPREHRSFRLDARTIAILEDLATGAEEGDAGLKSCAMGAVSAGANGADAAEVNATHHREIATIDDEDECFDAMGELLINGFSREEVASTVSLSGGATKLLALERWCDRVRLRCKQATDYSTLACLPWTSTDVHDRRRRGHRAMAALRATPEGTAHAAVLHIVYGWLDPFVHSLPAEIIVELGREFSPLARYTDAVEIERIALAHREGMRGCRSASSEVVDLADARDRVARAERMLSSGDALRSALAPPRARHADEDKDQYREHVYAPARDAREAFLTAVKLDANRMLTEASLAFKAAWFGS